MASVLEELVLNTARMLAAINPHEKVALVRRLSFGAGTSPDVLLEALEEVAKLYGQGIPTTDEVVVDISDAPVLGMFPLNGDDEAIDPLLFETTPAFLDELAAAEPARAEKPSPPAKRKVAFEDSLTDNLPACKAGYEWRRHQRCKRSGACVRDAAMYGCFGGFYQYPLQSSKRLPHTKNKNNDEEQS